MSRGAKKKFESIMRLVSDDNFDTGDPRRHVKGPDDCKGILNDSADGDLAGERIAKKTVRSRRDSLASGADLYKTDVRAVLRRQLAKSLLQDMLFSSPDFLKKKEHFSGMLHGQKTQWKVQEGVMETRSSNVWQNSKQASCRERSQN